jgi:hypothetical protein
VVLAVFGCVLASADTALAAGGGGDPGDPVVTTVQASLTVTNGGGLVTGEIVTNGSGTVINCGSDCFEDLDYEKSCDPPPGPQLCSDDHVTVRLTASRAGFTPHWNAADCDAQPSASQCDVEVTGAETARVTWTDSSPPTVGFSSPAAVAGPSTVFTAVPSDNVGVTKVDFYVDGILRATDTSPPYQYLPDLSPYADGSSHTLKVIAQDTSGNVSSNLADAPSHTFSVDKSTSITGVTTPAALVAAAPAVSFTPPGDLKSAGMTCTTKRGTTTTGSTTGCTSPYTAQLGASPADGNYTVELRAEDAVGNVATVTRTFTLDTVNPQLQITGGPAEGGVVQSRAASFNFTSSDANGVTLSCKLDGAAFGSCSGADSHGLSGLSLGLHTFAVRAVDGAGNTTTVQRTFTVEDPPAPPSNGGQGSGTPTGGDTPVQTGDGQAGTGPTTQPGQGGSGQATTPGGQGESADPPVVAARSSAKFSVKSGETKVSKLKLSGLARGMVVEVSCKGKGCPRGTTKFTVKKTSLDLTSVFKKRTLGAGAKIEVRVTQSGRRGKLFRYTTQKGSKKPKVQTLVV